MVGNKKNIIHIGALLFVLNGILYVIGEFIAALGTGFPLGKYIQSTLLVH